MRALLTFSFNVIFFKVLALLLPSLQSFLLKPTMLLVFHFLDEQLHSNVVEKNFGFFVDSCVVYHICRARNDRWYAGKEDTIKGITSRIICAIHSKTHSWKNLDLLHATFPSYFNYG